MPKNLQNIWLIAKREYTERVRTKAFIISTVLIPALMGGGVFGVAAITRHSKTTSHIAIMASEPQPARDLKQELEHGEDTSMAVDLVAPGNGETLSREIAGKQIDGYLEIIQTPDSDGALHRPVFNFTPRSSADIATSDSIKSALQTVMTREYLAAHHVSAEEAKALLDPAKVNVIESNGRHADSKQSFYVAYTLFFLMYMVVLLYGMNVARSIIEEKTSRIFEVLLATIKPDELLAGKILGVGSVGLTQVGIWMAAALLFATQAGAMSGITINATQIIFFIIYFTLGYALYSSVAAALGAMTNSEQELQQLNMFLMMPLFLCMGMLPVLITSPNSLLARIVSQIPFCAPLLMNFRISIAMPQPWEIALSIGLIVVSIFAVLWISSRIYRVGILMYGKKPNLPEILRWLKYS
ncbi:ABC transporter permease [Granulicella paludicola]|uniref:ABC transporter permease n=1 Tax=Granulicella paludicola TaxID=474951 RepID=UPI0021DFB8AB|nr:ABC transporter permease [Granulicella paludicola]